MVIGSSEYLFFCMLSTAGASVRDQNVLSTSLPPIRKTPGPRVRQSARSVGFFGPKHSRERIFFSQLSPMKSTGIFAPGFPG